MRKRILCLAILGALIGGTTIGFAEGTVKVHPNGGGVEIDTRGATKGHFENGVEQPTGLHQYGFDQNGKLVKKSK